MGSTERLTIATSIFVPILILSIINSFMSCNVSKRLNNIIFASPSKSQIRVLQSIGRGLRKSADGKATKVYDIADDLHWKSKKNYTLVHFYNLYSCKYRNVVRTICNHCNLIAQRFFAKLLGNVSR